MKCNTPIIAAIQWNQEREDCYCYNTVGWCANNDGELDLFFAGEGKVNIIIDELKSYLEKTPKEQVDKDWKEIQDWYSQHFTNENTDEKHNEEEELTEFEKELQIIISEASYWTSEDGSISTYCQFGDKEIKKISAQVLDLARKEIRKEQQEKLGTLEMPIDVTEPYYIKGKEDALKDLDSLIEDKVAEKFAELFSKLPMQPYPYQPNPSKLQSHWKPSEEQMNALDKAKNNPANYYDIRLGLRSLYNDLKKLKS